MWIARDENGALYAYADRPKRYSFCFYSTSDGLDKGRFWLEPQKYPEVTWENSPKELVVKEEVVDASICAVYPLRQCNEVHFAVDYPLGVLPHKDGDKVKLIIVKEDSV